MSIQKNEKYVYFLRPIGMFGPIKIGCSNFPNTRLEQINPWCPFPLELLVSIPGTFELETTLHKCFSDYHSHGEWFHPNDELLAGIAALKGGAPVEKAFNLDRQGKSIWLNKRKGGWSPGMKLRRSYVGKTNWAVRRLTNRAQEDVYFCLPNDIEEIIRKSFWRRHLTAEEIEAIEKFLDHPEKYAVKHYRARSVRRSA